LTSNRLTADHAPGLPEASLARTRHHILRVGRVLFAYCDAVTVAVATRGVVKVSESSIWIE
jgi:hypothetical protein